MKRQSEMLARTAFSIVAFRLVLVTALVTAFPTDAQAQEKQADRKAEQLPARLVEARTNAVKPTRMAIQLVDSQGHPVKGAIASTWFQRNVDTEPVFKVPERHESAISNEQGELALKLQVAEPPGRGRHLRDPPGPGSPHRRHATGFARGNSGGEAGQGCHASGLPRPNAN